eukprot:g30766.t1
MISHDHNKGWSRLDVAMLFLRDKVSDPVPIKAKKLRPRHYVKKAQQRLFFLRQLRKFSLSIRSLTNFYSCTTESILSGCITAWYGNCSAQ